MRMNPQRKLVGRRRRKKLIGSRVLVFFAK